jgi:hypothetical protein
MESAPTSLRDQLPVLRREDARSHDSPPSGPMIGFGFGPAPGVVVVPEWLRLRTGAPVPLIAAPLTGAVVVSLSAAPRCSCEP